MNFGAAMGPTPSHIADAKNRSAPSRANRASPVLIVEDHDDTRAMVADLLSGAGYVVVTAENGRRGLEVLRAASPCLIVLDLTMPIMSGWEFRRAQLGLADEHLASVPVLVMTALPNPERAAADLGAAGVIPKPLDLDRLLAAVRAHCGDP